MIPKIIHYCWFGGKPLPDTAKKCINSWKEYLPDFEIVQWNESNFDIHSCAYVEQAYGTKKWAFVADYVRYYAVYHHGGIFLETDTEVIRSFDNLLNDSAYFGFGPVNMTIPTFGAEKGHPVLKI